MPAPKKQAKKKAVYVDHPTITEHVGQRSASTRRIYSTVWRLWELYLTEARVEVKPLSNEAYTGFLAEREGRPYSEVAATVLRVVYKSMLGVEPVDLRKSDDQTVYLQQLAIADLEATVGPLHLLWFRAQDPEEERCFTDMLRELL